MAVAFSVRPAPAEYSQLKKAQRGLDNILDLVVLPFAVHSEDVVAFFVRFKRGWNDHVVAGRQLVMVADLSEIDERCRLRRRAVRAKEARVQRPGTVFWSLYNVHTPPPDSTKVK